MRVVFRVMFLAVSRKLRIGSTKLVQKPLLQDMGYWICSRCGVYALGDNPDQV